MSGWLILCLVLSLLLLLGGLAFWWLRTQSGAAVRGFYTTVRQMEHDQGISDRYQVPWFLMLGDAQLGTRLCADWQLTAVGQASWFGRWWADQDGAVLAVPQALFLPEEGAPATLLTWRRLLSMLLRLRTRRPLDGVIWNIPLQRLGDQAALAQDTLKIRRRFSDLLQRLGLSLPVYVVVSGLEALPGFQDLLATLPADVRERTLGWSSSLPPEAAWQADVLDDALTQVLQSLRAAIIEAGVLTGTLSEPLYRFPQALEALRDGLRLQLDPVFQGNTLGEAPRLRGLYFCATQRIAAEGDDWRLSTREEPPSVGVFGTRLWQTRLLAEQGLAQVVPRILRLRQRWQRLAGGLGAALGAVWLLAMLWVWHEGTRDARVLSQRIQATQRDLAGFAGLSSSEVARRRLRGYWGVVQEAPRWHFASIAYPTSWFSSFDADMDDLLRGLTVSEALQPLHRVLSEELTRLRGIRSSDRRSNVESDSPEQWPNYVLAHDLAYGALHLEQRNRWYAQARDGGGKGGLEALVELGNDTLGMSFNPGALRHGDALQAALRGGALAAPPALDLGPQEGPIAQQFRELMRLWLGQYFLADNFVRPAGYLKLHLDKLKAGQGNSLGDLEETNALIDSLRNMVELTNAAWSHGSAQELVPGYRGLLDSVRQSSLLGPNVEASLNAEAGKLQRAFHDQWIASAGTRDNLLQQQAGGTLSLQEHVVALDSAIEALLRQDFAGAALRPENATPDARQLADFDARGLNTALAYYDSYRAYLNQEQARIPADYREALLQSAGDAVALAMWSSLGASMGKSGSASGRSFDVPIETAEKVRQAFEELDRSNLATALDTSLTRRALADIDSALANIDSLPLFRERTDIGRWDGSRNLGLQLYRSSDVQDLKQNLDQQFATILGLSETHAPALTWLKGRSTLAFSEQEKVRRFTDLSDELAKYKAQNPTSSPALLEQLLSRDFIDMDASNCAEILRTSMLANGEGDLARRTRGLRDQAQQRCLQLQQQGAAAAWSAIADYFNLYLANRFPFAYSLQAEDADPGRVQHLVELLDHNLARAQEGLKLSQSVDRPAAEDFLARLQTARGWLAPLFQRDKAGGLGLDLDVRWRTDRKDERGADQVIAWALYAGDRQLLYPGSEDQHLHWNVGEPVKLLLRWAKDGPQRPDIDPQQPSMAVADLEAGWEYNGPWALLRLMRSHLILQHQPGSDYTDFPLALQVPVRALASREPQALMFLRLSLMTQDSKLPLSIQPLPVRAPRSPFAGVGMNALAGNQEPQ